MSETAFANLIPLQKPVDVALREILGDDCPGGSSGPGGWSARKTFMECPQKWAFQHGPQRGEERPGIALQIGILFHVLRAYDYAAMILAVVAIQKCAVCKRGVVRERPRAPATICGKCGGTGKIEIQETRPVLDRDWLRRTLLDAKVEPEVVQEGFRLDEAYRMQYENDILEPLAVEERIEVDGVSARLDLIAKVARSTHEVPAGIWIVEHKTSRAADTAALEGWQNDGQLLGQMGLYRRAGLASKYGPLAGVIVNLVVKTKMVQFFRIPVPVEENKIRSHWNDLAVWQAFHELCAATGTYPRNRNSCVGRYGLCSFFQTCASR